MSLRRESGGVVRRRRLSGVHIFAIPHYTPRINFDERQSHVWWKHSQVHLSNARTLRFHMLRTFILFYSQLVFLFISSNHDSNDRWAAVGIFGMIHYTITNMQPSRSSAPVEHEPCRKEFSDVSCVRVLGSLKTIPKIRW